jgi:hypothetical protein
MAQINSEAITIGSQSASTVVAGPYDIDTGNCNVLLVTKTAAGGATTPTAYTLQVSPHASSDVWGTVPGTSVTITASGTGNTVVTAGGSNICARRIRVISGAAFAAGSASLYVHTFDGKVS